MLAPLRHAALHAVVCATIGLGTGCTTSSSGSAGPVTVTTTSATVDASSTLVVKGSVCNVAPPLRLELVETRETYPVRFVVDVRPSGPPSPGCRAFESAMALGGREPFAQGCRERCLIEIRTPSTGNRTIEYRSPGGK